MTTRQPPPVSRANAEAILTGTATERSELAQIVAAARAPATADELAGEAAAMIRFQAARLEPAAAHDLTVRKRMSDKLLAVKVGIVAALAAAATGGVALAAAAHIQTEPAHHAPPADTSVAAPSHDGTPAPRATKTTKAAVPPAPSRAAAASAPPIAPGGAGSHPSASPSSSLRGLCVAYLANGIAGGKRMDNPAFGGLVTAAGGKDKVTTYCLILLRADPRPIGPAKSYPIGPPIPWPGHRSGSPDVPPPGGPQGDQP
jgi:hypothetical protein